jgi:hypothetical protein
MHGPLWGMANGHCDNQIFSKLDSKLRQMTRETLIKRTIDNLTKLPDQKLKEVSDFAEFLLNRIENQLMTEGIQKLVTGSKTFKFLEGEEDLYSVDDLKEKYK